MTQKGFTWEQTAKKKKRHEQKVTAKEKKGTGVMEDNAKKNFGKACSFCKAASVTFTWALSAVCALHETQAVSSHIKLQLCMHKAHMKGLYAGPKFCLAFTAFSISKH